MKRIISSLVLLFVVSTAVSAQEKKSENALITATTITLSSDHNTILCEGEIYFKNQRLLIDNAKSLRLHKAESTTHLTVQNPKQITFDGELIVSKQTHKTPIHIHFQYVLDENMLYLQR